MGVQMPVVPPFPGEYFEPQGSLFSRSFEEFSSSRIADNSSTNISARFRVPPTTPLRHFNSRGGGPDSPGGGGGVRRRAKSPTSVPSSADATSPQQSRDVGRERRVRECKENRDEGTSPQKSQAEEPATPPAKNESGRRENQKFSAATPTNDPRSSAPLRSLRTEVH
ncbi:hypothetical protein ANCCAN_09506 [Ancylostoma caninum]|uniref:Uncharacterized protein n=1 Tax=Ancylostoma caninum TaxID=29170 RepID=A0A368GNE3_ANCCA|nr:hypothetical protein ANCCAN_09506 [Ancylostoma caninum]